MNSSLATLAIFLVAAVFLSQTAAHNCCLKYTKRPVPQRLLKSYEHTTYFCNKRAIIFITHKNRRICADPNAKWVQDRMKHLPEV